MKLLLSSLLLASLCALSSWSVSSGTLVVTQSPDVSVMEGDTVNITCCWTQEFERITVNWLKNLTNIKNEVFVIIKNQSQGSLQNNTSNCSQLIFTNITKEDSGKYICKVTIEIPLFSHVEGNGTVITLRNNTTDDTVAGSSSSSLPFFGIISLAVVASLLLIALICFCILRRRQALAARVIYEVPHFDSEEVEMDKHSTNSSRGSSQWCQVPVYESVDYFERAEAKESG